MDHVLDNPVWNALLSGNKHLAQGTAQAKYFAQDISPFVGLPDTTPQDFRRLYDSIPYQGPFGVITRVPCRAKDNSISNNFFV
jgi:hypothetical protein